MSGDICQYDASEQLCPQGMAVFLSLISKGDPMENRVAVLSIIVGRKGEVEKLNSLLHDFGNYIIGRMGIPYRQKGINIISVVVDAPQDKIAALSGRIGNLQNINVKTAYSNVQD